MYRSRSSAQLSPKCKTTFETCKKRAPHRVVDGVVDRLVAGLAVAVPVAVAVVRLGSGEGGPEEDVRGEGGEEEGGGYRQGGGGWEEAAEEGAHPEWPNSGNESDCDVGHETLKIVRKRYRLKFPVPPCMV